MREDVERLFSCDGLVHTNPVGEIRHGKKEQRILNQISFDDAAVCLRCDALFCEGERKCFKLKKAAYKRSQCATVQCEDLSDEYMDMVEILDNAPSFIGDIL